MMSRSIRSLFLGVSIATMIAALVPADVALAKSDGLIPPGGLQAKGPDGESLGDCPLKHTDVKVEIAGMVARVTVKQQFHNPFKEKIEAVYVFPMSQDAAVDDMTMTIGDRVIKGEIKERGEARRIYDAARAQGKVASLLDQERPNIFTQSVANIEPGKQIDIEISYTETLDWDEGEYHFDFPMVVGPRYMPGTPTGAPTTGWAPSTDQVPDANKISPPVAKPGTRAGHDISVTVDLNAGLPIHRVDSKQHEIDLKFKPGDQSQATIVLKNKAEIPNKDFVLVYETASDQIKDTVLTHTDERGKFFTMILQPPKRVRPEAIVPREIIFVVDSSGSMGGFPIETAKAAMKLCIENARPEDRFNLMTFAGSTQLLFPGPVENTPENRKKALEFLSNLRGGGGTEMMTAIHACLADQHDPKRTRIVCFMTDAYVGSDMAILDAIQKNAGTARVFSFGIGRSVNRYLIDGMARLGRGEATYILDEQQAVGAAEKFYQRVQTPVLSDVELDFGDLEVTEVYPPQLPDLFDCKPIIVKGQYKDGGKGTITIRGKTGEGPFERKVAITLPDEAPENEVLAPLWARAKVEDLMNQTLGGMQRGEPKPDIKEEILGLGLRYRLLTQYTSFVAVEHKRITEGGEAKLVPVEVEMPEGVSYEGVFGANQEMEMRSRAGLAAPLMMRKQMAPQAAGSRALQVFPATKPMAPPPIGAIPSRPQNGPAGPGAVPVPVVPSVDAPTTPKPADPTAQVDWKTKLDPALRAVIDKLLDPSLPATTTVGTIKLVDGTLTVEVLLTKLDLATLQAISKIAQIKIAGANATRIVCTIKPADLEALAKLSEVKTITATP